MTCKFCNRPAKLGIIAFLYTLCLLGLYTATCWGTQTDAKEFPHYKATRKNVAFWEKIYSTYSLNEAVIHDSEDLSKIYEVIPMVDHKVAGAARINARKQKHVRKKYSKILKKLAHSAPTTRDEKRIAALFTGKKSKKRMGRAADNVRSQSGQKERFLAGVIRSGAYMKEMKKIFRQNGLPEDLAYLPHVESSFNTRAYSKFGAAGIWQFTRSTGKQYLTINYTLDERLDPILATHAAAKYLKKSYRHLKNWPLAVTSYNYGLAGSIRAQNEKGDYVKVFKKYNKGHFKFASKNFYSEFLAALDVAKKLEKSTSVKVSRPQSRRYLKLKGFVSVKKLAKHFATSTDSLKTLNPALRSPVFTGEKLVPKGYTLRLPAGKKTAQRVASFPTSLYKNKQKSSLFHRVKKGDTAGSIAKLHGISLKNLMRTNNLDEYATIYQRQKLRIPRQAEAKSTKLKSVPKLSARTKKVSEISGKTSDTPVLVAEKKQRPTGQGLDFIPKKDPNIYGVFKTYRKNNNLYGSITVQPEESLGLYAEWLGTKVEVLAKLNALKVGATVTPGQKVLLPFNTLSPNNFEDKRLDFLQETEEDFFSAFAVIGQKTYRVSSGDTLWDLCYNKFDIPLWLLERYNSTINLTRLSKEQELIVPIVQSI